MRSFVPSIISYQEITGNYSVNNAYNPNGNISTLIVASPSSNNGFAIDMPIVDSPIIFCFALCKNTSFLIYFLC